MLRKSLILGSCLAVALTAAGSAWAGDKGGYDDGYYDRSHRRCPAKSEDRCENKGGYFKEKNGVKTCYIPGKIEIEYCGPYKQYKAVVQDLAVWTKTYGECRNAEVEKILKCKTKDKWGRYSIVASNYPCKKACDDEQDDDDDNWHNGHDKGDGGKGK